MPDSIPPDHRRPHQPPMDGAFLEFDLTTEVEQLHREPTWANGLNSRTLVKYDDLRVVLTAVQALKRVPEHSTDGRVSIHALSGHLRVSALGRTFDLRSGSLLALDQGVAHALEALAESVFLLTIAWPGRGQRA